MQLPDADGMVQGSLSVSCESASGKYSREFQYGGGVSEFKVTGKIVGTYKEEQDTKVEGNSLTGWVYIREV